MSETQLGGFIIAKYSNNDRYWEDVALGITREEGLVQCLRMAKGHNPNRVKPLINPKTNEIDGYYVPTLISGVYISYVVQNDLMQFYSIRGR